MELVQLMEDVYTSSSNLQHPLRSRENPRSSPGWLDVFEILGQQPGGPRTPWKVAGAGFNPIFQEFSIA